MSASNLKLLFLGATGFVGGTVFDKLFSAAEAPDYLKRISIITVLVRSQDKLDLLKSKYTSASQKLDVKLNFVLGSLTDTALTTKLASETDIVLNIAESDDVSVIRALVDGLVQRKKSASLSPSLKQPIYIHTNGSAVLSVFGKLDGSEENSRVFTDLEPDEIYRLPGNAIHQAAQLEALKSVDQGIDLLSVVPPEIYGIGRGIHRTSIQIPALIRAAYKTGAARLIGDHLNTWSSIHVDDVADAYILLLGLALDGKADVGRQGWYYTDAGLIKFGDVSKDIGKLLNKKVPQIVKSPEAQVVSYADYSKYFDVPSIALGGNSVYRGDRLRKYGWTPKASTSYADYLEQDVDIFLAQQQI